MRELAYRGGREPRAVPNARVGGTVGRCGRPCCVRLDIAASAMLFSGTTSLSDAVARIDSSMKHLNGAQLDTVALNSAGTTRDCLDRRAVVNAAVSPGLCRAAERVAARGDDRPATTIEGTS